MESVNNTEKNRGAELAELLKHDLNIFFANYSASELKRCLQNIYIGYLGSDRCTENSRKVRELDGVMLLNFIEALEMGIEKSNA